jgi:hypothetical protein
LKPSDKALSEYAALGEPKSISEGSQDASIIAAKGIAIYIFFIAFQLKFNNNDYHLA